MTEKKKSGVELRGCTAIVLVLFMLIGSFGGVLYLLSVIFGGVLCLLQVIFE